MFKTKTKANGNSCRTRRHTAKGGQERLLAAWVEEGREDEGRLPGEGAISARPWEKKYIEVNQ